MKTITIEKAVEIECDSFVEQGTSYNALIDFAELIKARLTLLVLVTTAVGFYLGAETVLPAMLFHVVFGTALAAAGAAALNQWWEHQLDALMHRTKKRPIPSGRMLPRNGLAVGSGLGLSGVCYLAVMCNWLSASLAAATIVIYIFGYTPLKRISTTNTLVGAIPGALPPLIGWAAARNDLAWPAWTLFAILFCWQMPHFFAIGWIYRDDYARAGFQMLSGRDLDGARSGRQSVFFAILLLGASLAPAFLGLTGGTYLILVMSGLFAALAVRFYLRRNIAAARHLFVGSIVYLPMLLATLVFTKA